MIIKICDRCGKTYNPPVSYMQAKLPKYKITTFGRFPQMFVEADLCDKCRDDFDAWINEFKVKSLDCAEVNNDESAKL